MLRRICLLVLLYSFSFLAWGAPNGFEEHFSFVRKQAMGDQLVSVQAKIALKTISFETFIRVILGQVSALKNNKSMLNDYKDHLRIEYAKSGKSSGEIDTILDQIESIDFDKITESFEFKSFVKQFEEKLRNSIDFLDIKNLAELENSTYFYKKAQIYTLTSWGLQLIQKIFKDIPMINLVTNLLMEFHNNVVLSRTYFQNMLLHYLESYPHHELGLTKEEADKIFSSIYESRISWPNPQESQLAQQDWRAYGSKKFYQEVRTANSKLRNYSSSFEQIGLRQNYLFQEVVLKNERVVINLLDGTSMFSAKPSVAFNFENPRKVSMYRGFLSLVSLGMDIINVPSIIRNPLNNFMSSMYESQRISEGALYAYFISNGYETEASEVKKSYLMFFVK